ncbi:Putative Proteasome subunit beta type [[Torrubiella] hemipterigena]|uniref:Proteasome subunit beta n=2 Tax=[Torrubiella] hemipterigena TaxID=1531966 RepID=A0A0A1T5L9_9HYPO|nr:Putative Proteasome subunit beta type [[Torrubiella] hemipterigena]
MEYGRSGNLNEDGIHVDMDRLKKGEVNLGTSIMAVTFKDGVILGADSRTTTGSYIANRVTDKLTKVHDTIWCCRSGSAADTQAVADIVQYQLGLFSMQSGKPPMTQTAASIFQEMCYANKDRLSAGLIIAGWDERFGGQVYSIPLGGSLHKQAYAIGGSGSTYIYGYCDANWKENMEEEDAVNFVKGALREAIKWDGSSGGVIRMVVLTKKGADRHLYLPDTDYAERAL